MMQLWLCFILPASVSQSLFGFPAYKAAVWSRNFIRLTFIVSNFLIFFFFTQQYFTKPMLLSIFWDIIYHFSLCFETNNQTKTKQKYDYCFLRNFKRTTLKIQWWIKHFVVSNARSPLTDGSDTLFLGYHHTWVQSFPLSFWNMKSLLSLHMLAVDFISLREKSFLNAVVCILYA